MCLIILGELLDRQNVVLTLVYTPYGRQDRWTSSSEPFSLKTFCSMINLCNFQIVKVFDPHSYVTCALIDSAVPVPRLNLMHINRWRSEDDLILLSPDAGAMKENNVIAKYLKIPHISATKIRDVNTGEITETQIHTTLDLHDKKILICDDICDGGRTFIELAKVLKQYNPAEIHLHVSYGIFSQGIEVLQPYFTSITAINTRSA